MLSLRTSLPAIRHPIRVLVPLLVAVAPTVWGCASSPAEKGLELAFGRAYTFSGMIAGDHVSGSVTFPEEGGYLVRSNHGVCDVTGDRGGFWTRGMRGRTNVGVRCGTLLLNLAIEDGEIKRHATAHIRKTETREVRDDCAIRNEDTGACVRWHYVPRSRDVTYTGTVSVADR